MSRIEFTLAAIEKLDAGRIAEAFRQALSRVSHDLQDRPACRDPRKIVLECTFKPEMDDAGDLDAVKAQFQVKDTLPQRKSKVYDFGSTTQGHLYFQELDPDDHRQETMPMD